MAEEMSNSSEALPSNETPLPPDAFFLISSDGHHVPVDRLLLAASSSVFRDMLESVPTDKGMERACPVAETRADLEILFDGLKGEAKRSEAVWLVLYKLMDKYDIPLLRILLRLMAREMLDEDSLYAYCAYTLLGDRGSQAAAAHQCVSKNVSLDSVDRMIWNASPTEERLRLIIYKLRYNAVGFEALQGLLWRRLEEVEEEWGRRRRTLTLFNSTDVSGQTA
ncbi:hypothetical protein JCM10908_001949 [Rhodotorula pacifica]|uniref:uncharacterized protein n=1 Tax=Rhodotorula pacifica TaxID=1495444 RepID=UPI00317286AE